MEEDSLKKYVNSLGIDGRLLEEGGDSQGLIRSVLSEVNSDPLLATVMRLMLAKNHTVPLGEQEKTGRRARTQAPLRRS